LSGAEILDLDNAEPPRNSGNAGCYWLFRYSSADLPPLPDLQIAFVRAGNYHINARKATIRASKLTSAVKRFKFASKVVEPALLYDFPRLSRLSRCP
jgi:hypothetical protein